MFDLKSKHSAGFSEFEFLGLIAAGLVIAALLAHFVFDQSIQVEKLHALVARDEVRLKLETRLADLDILKKSAQAIADDSDLLPLKACILGREGNQACKNKSTCCESRLKKSIPILDRLRKELGLSAEKKTTPDGGFTVETVSCLGACGLAPVITVNEQVYPAMTPDKASELVASLRAQLAAEKTGERA